MADSETFPKNVDELYFEHGGPIQRTVHKLVSPHAQGYSIRNRILSFLGLTWLPLVVLAIIEGRAWTSSPQESLLLDYATYARFFVGVPLLLIAEPVVGPRLRGAALQFLQGGFIREEDQPAFERTIATTARYRESFLAEVIIVLIALIGAWGFTAETVYGEGLSTWRSVTHETEAGTTVSFTGLWYRFIALPILQYFWYRWLWRLFVWGRFLWMVSRLDLRLVATHADQAGGLGFLGVAHVSLGIFAFALSSVLSAEAAFLMVFNHADINAFRVTYIVLLLFVEVAFLGPLLMFFPVLVRTRLAALKQYGLLVCRYNRAFEEKWITGNAPTDEPLLGSADIQSLADLGGSFEYVQKMKAVPFSQRAILQLAIIVSLPCLPLILLVVPIGEILDLLSKVVF